MLNRYEFIITKLHSADYTSADFNNRMQHSNCIGLLKSNRVDKYGEYGNDSLT